MSGKTVEEVAREIAIRFEPRDGMPDHPRTIWRHGLQDAIKCALRQREQETALECARIAITIDPTWHTGSTVHKVAQTQHAVRTYDAIKSRFPKDQG